MIKEKLKSVMDKIDAVSSGRDVKLIAVTKIALLEQIKEAVSFGVSAIGENRVQNAAEKFPFLENVEKHMIGTLQTNKVKAAVELFDVIQSVDSMKLAKEIDKRALNAGKLMPIFIEVNVAGEEAKSGIPVSEVSSFYDKILSLTNIKVEGLMTIAPFVSSEDVRPYFREMKTVFDSLKLKWLSMGMTNDFEVAIEEGSNMIRVGRAIFG